jgi:hypothetical protein
MKSELYGYRLSVFDLVHVNNTDVLNLPSPSLSLTFIRQFSPLTSTNK